MLDISAVCKPGFYRSALQTKSCSKCPPRSFTKVEASTSCQCEAGYYRIESDPANMACTSKCHFCYVYDIPNVCNLVMILYHLAEPPSAPRNAISNVNETSVFLEWSAPEETGGRKDVRYNILCSKISTDSGNYEPCGSHVRFLPQRTGLRNTSVMVVDLLAHTNYTFEVEAVNGVSELTGPLRQYVSLNVTTNQAGE